MRYAELVTEIERLTDTERRHVLALLTSPAPDATGMTEPEPAAMTGGANAPFDRHIVVLAPDDIRVRGSRIGIQSVLYEYIHRSRTPEQIVERYATLSLEQIYAVILYYLSHREMIAAYLANWLEREAEALTNQAEDAAFQAFLERLRVEQTRRMAGIMDGEKSEGTVA